MLFSGKRRGEFFQFLRKNREFGSFLKKGELVEGKVLKKEQKSLYLDLGKYGTGIVYGAEFISAKQFVKSAKEGDVLVGKVIKPMNESGLVEISLTEVKEQKVWEKLKKALQVGEIIKVKATGCNRGGLLADIDGISAFIPISQLATKHCPQFSTGQLKEEEILESLRKLVGQYLSVKVIDVNPVSNRVTLSERAALTESLKELVAKYKIGQIVEGIVSAITDLGVFIKLADYPDLEGLIRPDELSHALVALPEKIVKLNQKVKAKIIDIKNGRIFLSLKALTPDPWEKLEQKYKVDQLVKGKVVKLTPFGAFISLNPQIQGIIHVSEFGGVEQMRQKLEVNKSYKFRISLIKPQNKRLILKYVSESEK